MAELEEHILSSTRERDSLSVDDLLREIEQHHSAEEPGVPRETLVEYGRALTDADLTLYARDETPIKTIETRTFALESDEQRAIEQQLHMPEDAASSGVAAFEATDTRALPDSRPSS